MPGAMQLWVTTAAGPYPAADPYRAGQSVRRCRSPASMPGAFTARSVRAPDATPVVSATGEAALALQLMPGYVQAPDRGGHPLRWRRTIAGQSSALKVGTVGQLADSCPLAAARALSVRS